jgi:flagellin-like hook-associated protein FlgL
MSRIGATISGLDQYFLSQLKNVDNRALQSAVRLATGKQVPRPSFDPAAFVLISSFENRLNVIESTKAQVDVAANLGAETQLVLDQTRSNLESIRTALLLDEDLSLSSEDRDAQQAVVDAAVLAIRDLAGTEINGRRVVDGSVNYTFSGRDHTQIKSIQAFGVRETSFSGEVTSAATQSNERYTGAGGNINSGNATFALTGDRGSASISVTDGEALTDVRDRINAESHNTGITASVSGDQLDFTTVDYGDDATIEIDVTSGVFATSTTTTGQDAVVTINDQAIANAQVDGNRVSYTNNGTHVSFEFQAGFSGTFSTVTVSDGRTQKFALTPDISKQTTFALPGIQPELLGGASGTLADLLSGGSLSGLGSNASAALRVVDETLAQLTLLEGQVDAFTDVTVESASNLLSELEAEVEDTLQVLNDVDEDEENLKLAMNQTLASNVVSALAIVQQQRFNTLGLLQLLAGI